MLRNGFCSCFHSRTKEVDGAPDHDVGMSLVPEIEEEETEERGSTLAHEASAKACQHRLVNVPEMESPSYALIAKNRQRTHLCMNPWRPRSMVLCNSENVVILAMHFGARGGSMPSASKKTDAMP